VNGGVVVVVVVEFGASVLVSSDTRDTREGARGRLATRQVSWVAAYESEPVL